MSHEKGNDVFFSRKNGDVVERRDSSKSTTTKNIKQSSHWGGHNRPGSITKRKTEMRLETDGIFFGSHTQHFFEVKVFGASVARRAMWRCHGGVLWATICLVSSDALALLMNSAHHLNCARLLSLVLLDLFSCSSRTSGEGDHNQRARTCTHRCALRPPHLPATSGRRQRVPARLPRSRRTTQSAPRSPTLFGHELVRHPLPRPARPQTRRQRTDGGVSRPSWGLRDPSTATRRHHPRQRRRRSLGFPATRTIGLATRQHLRTI